MLSNAFTASPAQSGEHPPHRSIFAQMGLGGIPSPIIAPAMAPSMVPSAVVAATKATKPGPSAVAFTQPRPKHDGPRGPREADLAF